MCTPCPHPNHPLLTPYSHHVHTRFTPFSDPAPLLTPHCSTAHTRLLPCSHRRLKWETTALGYDRDGPLRGWEMQTGVLAYKRNARTLAFWAEATRIYLAKGGGYWEGRSSGEQVGSSMVAVW